jgi:hypothetical protein
MKNPARDLIKYSRRKQKVTSGTPFAPYHKKEVIMPWYNGDYPPSYKNQPPRLRAKAVEIANEIIMESGDEGIAIATGLKKHGNI